MSFLKLLSSAALTVALVGCSSSATQNEKENAINSATTVSGSVIYRDRMALPEKATITVTLADVSLADAPAKVLSTVTIPSEGKQVPFMFKLPYNNQQLAGAQRVSLFATISVDGKLLYTTTTMNEVLTNGQPAHADLILDRVQH
ncbi:YbaY family lipoprotein [Limnobaculum zhutongyuii]|nr:YbaY family lipoprotein [Limnobaculum zhutongyuii]